MFWPVQLVAVLQPFWLSTLVIGNLYFWTVLGVWLGLLLDRPAAPARLAAA